MRQISTLDLWWWLLAAGMGSQAAKQLDGRAGSKAGKWEHEAGKQLGGQPGKQMGQGMGKWAARDTASISRCAIFHTTPTGSRGCDMKDQGGQ